MMAAFFAASPDLPAASRYPKSALRASPMWRTLAVMRAEAAKQPMAQYLVVHAFNPQRRLIRRAVDVLQDGGLIAYPTDSCYALGCRIGAKEPMERLRRIRGLDEDHHLTLVCRDLSELSSYARVDNPQYRLLRGSTPGSYTFILRASREVPRRLLNPRRRTIGLRVPQHPVVHALLEELGEPILSSTLMLPGDAYPLSDAAEIRNRLEHEVDLVLDAGSCGLDMTTVIDLTGEQPTIVRAGKGALAPFLPQAVH
jgi:tRNA threonylcarbamoyl adenosine modification protein (Sua5/YciO/YrdC/YwlC family)